MPNNDALKNQALYWRAFAALAIAGKRNREALNAALFLYTIQPPEAEDVQQIVSEAQEAYAA